MPKQTYQVWQWHGNPYGFPHLFTHVANVQANGLKEVVELTKGDTGGLFDDSQPWIRWQEKSGVSLVAMSNREIHTGDVIVDPRSDAYQLCYSALTYSQGRPVWGEQEFFEHIRPRAQGIDPDDKTQPPPAAPERLSAADPARSASAMPDSSARAQFQRRDHDRDLDR